MPALENIIVKPLITEKASVGAEKRGRYGFQVHINSNKHNIRKAVESFYDVKVTDVITNIRPGKLKRVGKTTKKTPKTKYAYVKLGKDQKIEFFKGV